MLRMNRFLFRILPLVALIFLASCGSNESIVNTLSEREANEIVVYLASKGIDAQKVEAPPTSMGAAAAVASYNIMVSSDKAVDAMAILGRAGLPRRMGTNLLELFAKSGLMSSDREETIRYQAGLAEELKNTIRKIDGVLDADVQISFPDLSITLPPGSPLPKVTSAIYVKHQGIFEDPNSHLEIKIKRLMAGSVNGLDYDNVTVISDRSKYSDINLSPEGEMIGPKALQQTYVTIWGLVMTQSSLSRFRVIFFTFILLILAMLGAFGWIGYKFYPQLRAALFKRKETPQPPMNL